jgi:hypothetical protein
MQQLMVSNIILMHHKGIGLVHWERVAKHHLQANPTAILVSIHFLGVSCRSSSRKIGYPIKPLTDVLLVAAYLKNKCFCNRIGFENFLFNS